MDAKTSPAPSLSASADHFGIDRSDNPYWNESVWFSIAKPDERLNGIIQYYFRPNMRMLNGGPILWHPDQNFQWNCLYYDWSHLQPAPDGAEKFNFKAANGLEVRVLEPLTRYAIRYDNEGLKLDLIWQAIGPLHDMKTGKHTQNQTAKFHFEQPGHMVGSIKTTDREIAIDCFSMRDGSSGPRQYETISPGSYFWGIAADSCFHAIALGAGRERKLMGGFMWKDGAMASLAKGTRTALEYGAYGPSLVRFEGEDTLGRSIILSGRVEQGFIHTGYTTHSVVWAQTVWDWDGITHMGEHQEFCSAEAFRQIMRGNRILGG